MLITGEESWKRWTQLCWRIENFIHLAAKIRSFLMTHITKSLEEQIQDGNKKRWKWISSERSTEHESRPDEADDEEVQTG